MTGLTRNRWYMGAGDVPRVKSSAKCKAPIPTDSRKKSVSEALLNSFGAYPIGYAIGIIVLPLSVGWIERDPFTVNLLITGVYATVSFLRTYYLRRLFERYGINDNIAILAIRGIKKLAGLCSGLSGSYILKRPHMPILLRSGWFTGHFHHA